MAIKAVDIALIPPVGILRHAILLNRDLPAQPNKISLNEKDCMPHITLAMGFVESTDIEAIKQGLLQICKEHKSIELEYSGTYLVTASSGEKINGVSLKLHDKMRKLHEASVELLRPYVKDYSALDALAKFENADPITLEWIKSFNPNSVAEHFNPHITIGFGYADYSKYKGKIFSASNLSLYQLGNYCTCASLIQTKNLR